MMQVTRKTYKFKKGDIYPYDMIQRITGVTPDVDWWRPHEPDHMDITDNTEIVEDITITIIVSRKANN